MRQLFRILFVGDVIGPAGCAAARGLLPGLRSELALDAIIINGENSADDGLGITPRTAHDLLAVADCVTLGDHAFDHPEIGAILEQEPRIIRPANVAAAHPGRGWGLLEVAGGRVGVTTLQGRVFMRELPESPFAGADRAVSALKQAGADLVIVEIHCEATSEKQGMGWHCAGRVAAVLGTHTHTPTADARLLPGGTAYITDVGMTGSHESIIGFQRDGFLRFLASGDRPAMPLRPGTLPARLDAAMIEVDAASGRAISIERIVRTFEQPDAAETSAAIAGHP
jgi:metallophosphoesterase (TIGR00282 family)